MNLIRKFEISYHNTILKGPSDKHLQSNNEIYRSLWKGDDWGMHLIM